MREFLSWDGPFFRVVSKLVDMVFLTMLFWLTCIPLFTVGASVSALYYVSHKVLRHGHGYVAREYFSAFRSNFKQATIVWVGLLIFYGVVGMECYLMYEYALKGDALGRIYVVLLVLIAFVVAWSLYIFPYIARFQNKLGPILKNAIFFMMGNLGKSVILFLLLVIALLLVVAWPWLVAVLPAVYVSILEWNLEKVFEKYMTPEDLAAEQERNREYKNEH